jgi:hypothetical protein
MEEHSHPEHGRRQEQIDEPCDQSTFGDTHISQDFTNDELNFPERQNTGFIFVGYEVP